MLGPQEFEEIREREAVVYAGAARIFTTSHKLREVFIAHFGVDARRVETIHTGPNFPYGESPEIPARAPDGPPTILFVGKAFHRKGGDLLLEAFKQVRHRIPDARLTILGPDAMSAGVEGAPGVDFVGFVNKATPEGQARINQAYASARVFCLPTRFEPFGVVFLEAMHYALPVVAPRAWAVPEIVEDGVTGLTVDPDDVDALAGALIDLLSDLEKARTFGLAGKRRLEEHFSWARVVNRMTRALTAMLSPEQHRD